MTSSATTMHGQVLLLAERLRVEERLLIEAFTDAGWQAGLMTPEEAVSWVTERQREMGEHEVRPYERSFAGNVRGVTHHARLDQNGHACTIVVISRLPAGRESMALLSLLDDAGVPTINSLDLSGLLANRDRLVRNLVRHGIASLPTSFAFGAEGVLSAAERTGYPAMLLPLNGDEPGVVVEDREAAEAVVEHRVVLGRQRAMLIRPEPVRAPRRQVIVAGTDTFVTVARDGGDPSTGSGQAWQPAEHLKPQDIQVASRLRETLGVGIYAADIVDADDPLLLDVKPLNGFRAIHQAGLDIAGAFVRLVEDGENGDVGE